MTQNALHPERTKFDELYRTFDRIINKDVDHLKKIPSHAHNSQVFKGYVTS